MRESRTSEYQCEECGHKWSGFEWTKNQIKKYNITCEKCESNNIKKLGKLISKFNLIIVLSIILISGLMFGIMGITLVDNANLNTFWIGFGIGCIIGLPLFCYNEIKR
ncbi:MAG: hypothetical protein ACFFDX_04235 [Candidatus Odinarchaeota archaeon]